MMARTTKLVPPAKSAKRLSLARLRIDNGRKGTKPTGEFVELQREGDAEEEELVANRDEEGDGKIVIIKGVDFGHDARRWNEKLTTLFLTKKAGLFKSHI